MQEIDEDLEAYYSEEDDETNIPEETNRESRIALL